MARLANILLLILVIKEDNADEGSKESVQKYLSKEIWNAGGSDHSGSCPVGYEKKVWEKRKRRFVIVTNINKDRVNNSSVSNNVDEEKGNRNNQIVLKETIKKKVRRGVVGNYLPREVWALAGQNKNIAKVCCFIIKSKTKGTFILTDHKKQNEDFDKKCPSQDCAYKPYYNNPYYSPYKPYYSPYKPYYKHPYYSPYKPSYNSARLPSKLGEEICLNDIGSDYTCCSQEDGAFCENYSSEAYFNPQYNVGNSEWCSKECAKIANCKNDPQNSWCQEQKIKNIVKEAEPATKPDPPSANCVAILKDEPVEQSAEYVPNALLHLHSYRRKRGAGIWSDCPQWNLWRFNCYKAVYYMLYNKKKHWYFAQKKQKWRYFEHECCPEFQSKCYTKKIFKENRAAALCPAYE